MIEYLDFKQGNVKFTVDENAIVRIFYKDECKTSFKVKTKEVLLDVLDNLKSANLTEEIDAEKLSEFCEGVEDLFKNNILNNNPKASAVGKSIMYVNNAIYLKDKDDKYYSKKVLDMKADVKDMSDTTYMKLCFMKNDIRISEEDFNKFLKDIKEFDKEYNNETIQVNVDNYREFIDKVPKKILIDFMNEYFNRR